MSTNFYVRPPGTPPGEEGIHLGLWAGGEFHFRAYTDPASRAAEVTWDVVDCHHADDCNHVCPEPDNWNPHGSLPCTEHPGDCNHCCSAWTREECWHWQLRDARPLKRAVPARGKLGLWRLPGDVEAAVRTQLEVSQ